MLHSPFHLTSFFMILMITSVYKASSYGVGERIILYVNKVVPYHNPFAMYNYYSLPFCQPEQKLLKSLSLEEILDGDRLTESQYMIYFLKEEENTTLCHRQYNVAELQQLRKAIQENFYYEFELDEILLRGFLGFTTEDRSDHGIQDIRLWTHLHFFIEYASSDVIYAQVDKSRSYSLSLNNLEGYGSQVRFSYSVSWHQSRYSYEERWKRQQETHFFPVAYDIHWRSLGHSFLVVLLLVVFVFLLIQRVLRRDFDRYNTGKEINGAMEEDDISDGGWKLIHGDVFRIPQGIPWLSAFVGSGLQLLISMAVLSLLFAVSDSYRHLQRHAVFSSKMLLAFFLTQGIAGFVSCYLYFKLQENGKEWVKTSNLSAILVSLPLFFIWSIVNTVAWTHHSTLALPATTILLLLVLWCVFVYPLCILFSLLGKRYATNGGGLNPPCRTRLIPREIPPLVWYKRVWAQATLAGFVQFSALSLELFYLLSSVWVRHHPDFHLVVAAILIKVSIVGSCVSIVFTYLQLAAEDYRWWWRSIYASITTALFVMGYAFYFLFLRTHMNGTLQLTQFFGCMVLIAFGFFLQFTAVGFLASMTFVKYMYRNVKLD